MIKRLTRRSLVSLVLVFAVNHSLAAPPVIGVVVAKGEFRVNESPVTGNATLFDGALIETGKASSSIHLSRGTALNLAGGSRVRVYRDRLVLERGESELVSGDGYTLEALGLRVQPSTPGVSARVVLQGGKAVQVAALAGEVRVLTGADYLVGKVTPGRILEFEPQAEGAATSSKIRGCLAEVDGKYYITDVTSGVRMQVSGEGLEKEVGNEVEITGASAGDQVQAKGIERLAVGCRAGAEEAAAGKSRSAKAAAGKAMTGTTKAIIAGVSVAAVAGTVAGIAVATQDEGPPPSSR